MEHHISFPVGLCTDGCAGTEHGGLVEIPNQSSDSGAYKVVGLLGIEFPGILDKSTELVIAYIIVGFQGFSQFQHFSVIGDHIARRIEDFPLIDAVIELLVLITEAPLNVSVSAPVISQV